MNKIRLDGLMWFLEKLLPPLLTVGLALAGYYFTSREDRLNAQRLVERSEIQDDINREIDAYTKTATALINIREVREEIVMMCRNNPRLVHDAQFQADANMRRFHARAASAKAMIGLQFAFPSNVSELVFAFNTWDEGISNVCAKDSPTDSQYREKMLAIQHLIKTIIEAKRQSLLHDLN